jgi:hypothetical protein
MIFHDAEHNEDEQENRSSAATVISERRDGFKAAAVSIR